MCDKKMEVIYLPLSCTKHSTFAEIQVLLNLFNTGIYNFAKRHKHSLAFESGFFSTKDTTGLKLQV